jgi:hypothetical protein
MEGRADLRGLAKPWIRDGAPYWLVLSMVMVVAGTSVAAATAIAPSDQRDTVPPAPQERIPPPPNHGTVTWQPGHWRWTGIAGIEWQWECGRYVEWPPNRAVSVTGQWHATPNGGDGIDDDWQ